MPEIITTVRHRDATRLPHGKVIPCASCKRIDDELAMQQREPRVPASSRPAQQQIAGLDTERPSGMPTGKGRP